MSETLRIPKGKYKLKTTSQLASALSISEGDLLSISEKCDSLYKTKKIPKKKGGYRSVNAPSRELKVLQRKINSRIFSLVSFPNYLQGSIKDQDNPRDYIRSASLHLKAGVFTSLDIKNFFDNIDQNICHSIFNDFFGYSEEVSDILSNLCTLNGYVPQGAPTSSYIANLVFFESEDGVFKRAKNLGVRYSRLVDDIVISHEKRNWNIDKITNLVKEMIAKDGFEINDNKSVINQKNNDSIYVHGIKVNFDEPKLPRKEVRNIRAAIKSVEDISQVPNQRTSSDYYRIWHSVSGKVNKLKRVGHPAYERYRRRLKRILPLPRKRDLTEAYSRVDWLENNRDKNNESVYRKAFYKAQERVSFAKRTYVHEARLLQNRLNLIRPQTDQENMFGAKTRANRDA